MSDTTKTKRLGDISDVVTMSNDDKFVIIVKGQEWLITKANLQKVFTGLSSEDYSKLNKLVINGNGTKFLNDKGNYIDNITLFNQEQFVKDTSGLIELNGYHIHDNQTDILDKFTVDNGKLLFDGQEISSYTLPIATETTLGGVKIDGDTIKINNGIISADVIGNWSAGVSYSVGYFAVYNDTLYECINANSDNVWTESNWKKISGSNVTGTTINNWSDSTDYAVGDLVINETTLYQCNTEHTSGETFDETELAKWTALSGARGEKGNDGISPTVSVEQTDAGCTITVTDKNGTTTADLSNGITPHIDETSKHWFVGEKDTGIVAEGVTTISTTSANYTATLTVDDWVGDTAPYTQVVNISGITSDLSPFIDLIVSDDITMADEEMVQWCYITKAVTGDNTITFRCNKNKPTIGLTVKIKVV